MNCKNTPWVGIGLFIDCPCAASLSTWSSDKYDQDLQVGQRWSPLIMTVFLLMGINSQKSLKSMRNKSACFHSSG